MMVMVYWTQLSGMTLSETHGLLSLTSALRAAWGLW